MSVINKSIRQTLLSLFDDEFKEVEAHEKINKLYGQKSISLATVYNWFRKFKSGDRNLDCKRSTSSKTKFTDEYLIELINSNPDLNMKELARIASASESTISIRIRSINNGGQKVNYSNKKSQGGKRKFTDEFLINLINDNPGLNMTELAKLTDTAITTISYRLNNINKSRADDDKIVIQKNLSKIKPRSRKFSDEFLINLINENPGLNMRELSQLADTSFQNISKRLQLINNNRAEDDKIILQKNTTKRALKKGSITDESLIKLINENPDLNMTDLASLTDTTQSTICTRINKINNNRNNDSKLNIGTYTNKTAGRPKKFTDEFLIELINSNPDLNMKELATLVDVAPGSISYRINQINKSRADDSKIILRVDSSKVREKLKKFTDEFLINLVNENPDLNLNELAKLANCSGSTILKRIIKLNSEGGSTNYIDKRGNKVPV